MKRLLIISLSILFFHTETSLQAQSWTWAQQLGDSGNESANDLIESENGDLLMAGSFSGSLTLGGQTLTSVGEEDVYLLRMDEEGIPIWGTGAGGVDIDESLAIEEDGEGNIYWAGTFWREITFDGQTIASGGGSKAIFIVKYSADGQLIWAQSLRASGLKDIGDIDVDTDDNIYLTGYFGGEFSLPDTTLIAKGEADLFVVKMNPEGITEWATASGETGFIRGINIAVHSADEVYVSGHFKGRIAFATDTIKTNTSDNDVFVACFDGEGNARWGRKAGGVHEDFCTGMTIDELGQIYISGYYYGVLNLGGGVEVQATGFNDNFYILKYASTGEPLWARTFGGQGLVHALDIQYQNGELLLGGYFRDDLTIATTSLLAEADFDTFLARYSSEDGSFLRLWQLPSAGFVLLSKLRYLDENNFLVIGSFTQNADFDAISLISNGAFDAFIARGNAMTTSLSSSASLRSAVKLFPNPVVERLNIQTTLRDYDLRLFNSLGQQLLSAGAVDQLDLPLLPDGTYYLQLHHESGQLLFPFIKKSR